MAVERAERERSGAERSGKGSGERCAAAAAAGQRGQRASLDVHSASRTALLSASSVLSCAARRGVGGCRRSEQGSAAVRRPRRVRRRRGRTLSPSCPLRRGPTQNTQTDKQTNASPPLRRDPTGRKPTAAARLPPRVPPPKKDNNRRAGGQAGRPPPRAFSTTSKKTTDSFMPWCFFTSRLAAASAVSRYAASFLHSSPCTAWWRGFEGVSRGDAVSYLRGKGVREGV